MFTSEADISALILQRIESRWGLYLEFVPVFFANFAFYVDISS
jgi:hypothetical protein